jgi:hypothetical protein
MKTERLASKAHDAGIPAELLAVALARLDRLALGLAIGLVAGTAIALSTVILLLKGGKLIGPHLALLGQYIPGYEVSWRGAITGGAGGFLAGFVGGWTTAFLQNLALDVYVFGVAFWSRLNRFLDDA